MGIFGSIIRSVGNWVGEKIESVGDFLGSDTISQFGRNIQDACAEKVGQEDSYDKYTANIYSTDRLNEILVSFSDGYFKQATSIENSCIRIVEEFYDTLIEMIENAPETSYNRANLNSLKRGRSKIRQSVTGGIKKPLAKRMSLDDSECLKILKMDQGSAKTKAMSAFSQKVIKEALGNLSRKVRESMNEQFEDIEDYLKSISEEQEKEFANFKTQFDKMCQDDSQETGKREQHCIEPLIIMDAIDEIECLLR